MSNTKKTKKEINKVFDDCVDCPYFTTYEYSSSIWCNMSDRELKESEPDEHDNMFVDIPDCCLLDAPRRRNPVVGVHM